MRKKLWLSIGLAVLVYTMGYANAQTLFHADFEDNKKPNNPDAWHDNLVTPGTLDFTVEDGRLKQNGNDLPKCGKALFPVNGFGWTDYTVATDTWERDNDVFGLIFRYTDPDSYYCLLVGCSEWNNQWCLAKVLAPDEIGVPHFDTGEGAENVLLKGVNANPLDETGKTAYTMAVTAIGNKIDLFFGPQVDILGGEMPPKIGEVTDDTFTKGMAGLYTSSHPSDYDNIIVFGAHGQPVDSYGKLTVTWGMLKSIDD